MRKLGYLLLSIVMLFALTIPAVAQEPTQKNWQWRLSPLYLWGVSISGDQTIGGATVPLELDFSDIFSNLETVFTANFEGMYNNKWGFRIDYSYIDIKGDQGPLSIKFQNTLAEVDGLYRFISGEHNLDFLFGLRYTDQETSVSPTPLNISQDWTDPVIGGRWIWDFADAWAIIAIGDIGGFGVGSDFTWQAMGLLEWQPFKYVSLVGGYRALYQDYEDGSGPALFRYKATLHGPVLGLNIKW